MVLPDQNIHYQCHSYNYFYIQCPYVKCTKYIHLLSSIISKTPVSMCIICCTYIYKASTSLFRTPKVTLAISVKLLVNREFSSGCYLLIVSNADLFFSHNAIAGFPTSLSLSINCIFSPCDHALKTYNLDLQTRLNMNDVAKYLGQRSFHVRHTHTHTQLTDCSIPTTKVVDNET